MKKILFALAVLSAVVLSSCSRHTSVSVDMPEMLDAKVYVVYADPELIDSRQQENIAETVLKEGKVTIDLDTLTIDGKTKDCTISIVNQSKNFVCTLPLPVEKNKDVTLTITGVREYLAGKAPLRVSYAGSKRAEDFSSFFGQVYALIYNISSDGANKKNYSDMVRLCRDFFDKYPESAFPYTVLISMMDGVEGEGNPLLKYCEELSGEKSDNVWHKYLSRKYKNKVTRDAMAKYMVFSAQDKDGKNYSERDFLGALTLVHFWCVQGSNCLAGLDEVKNFYSRYSTKGLQMISISIDPQPNLWLEWSKKNSFAWTSLIADGTAVTGRYNFNDIPLFILFSKDGKMIARGNRIEDLKEKIEDNLSK